MQIPERHVFYARVYGTMLGPFVNYACMRLIIDSQGPEMLTGNPSGKWAAPRTRNYYSLSVIWGVLGPKSIFGADSMYRGIILGLVAGPAFVVVYWTLRKRLSGNWKLSSMSTPLSYSTARPHFRYTQPPTS